MPFLVHTLYNRFHKKLSHCFTAKSNGVNVKNLCAVDAPPPAFPHRDVHGLALKALFFERHFKSVDNQNIIDFIKDAHFLSSTVVGYSLPILYGS